MQKLEARFHPWPSGQDSYVVVGYVIWDASKNDMPRIQPAPSLRDAQAPRAILATLRHLVSTLRTGYTQLASLRSRFWSFVPAQIADASGPWANGEDSARSSR
jgi:hypothetical protein